MTPSQETEIKHLSEEWEKVVPISQDNGRLVVSVFDSKKNHYNLYIGKRGTIYETWC